MAIQNGMIIYKLCLNKIKILTMAKTATTNKSAESSNGKAGKKAPMEKTANPEMASGQQQPQRK